MGFHAELLVVYSRPGVLGENKTYWEVQEIVPFKNITRIEKLIELSRNYGSHTRAGICIMSCIMEKLIEKLVRGPQWLDFAPRFLVYEDLESCGLAISAAKESNHLEYIDRGICHRDVMWRMVKNFHAGQMKAHNDILDWPQSKLDEYVAEKYNIVMHDLIMWESCATIANWLNEAEAKNTREWEEVKKDPISWAKFIGWREFLRSIGTVNARSLFLFPTH